MADQPLAARMRPRSFEEFVGQAHLVGPGKALTRARRGREPALDHPVGARRGRARPRWRTCWPTRWARELMQLSAVSSGVADARKVMEGARGGLFRTVLFVDEVHRWSKSQQDVLLPAVEEGTITLIGATTENPYFSLVTPLLSRCLLLRLEPLDDRGRAGADAARARRTPDRGLGTHGRRASTDEALDHLVDDRRRGRADGAHRAGGRGARRRSRRARPRSTRDLAADAVQQKAIVYDRQGDAHYDVISRVHQEHPRLRSGRRAVLAGADARGGGGCPVHRPADDRARLARTSGWRTRGRCWSRWPPRTPWSTSGCRRPA